MGFCLFACLILAPDSLKELCKSGTAANTATQLVLIAIHTSVGSGRLNTMIRYTLLSLTNQLFTKPKIILYGSLDNIHKHSFEIKSSLF